jgi:sugar phosphate isomerase/epimerase
MSRSTRPSLLYTRRDFGKVALAGVPAALLLGRPLGARANINSRIKNVEFGAITYSFRGITNPDDIIKGYVTLGLGEMELMSNHAEALAGAPPAPGRGGRGAQLTPDQQTAADAAARTRAEWRRSATAATWAPVRKKIEDAGIDLRLLCYNMNVKTTTDEDVEYGFTMAKGLGVRAMSTSTQISMAKRLAPFAEKHKMMVGFHGHNDLERQDEVSSKETFEVVMAAGKYLGANLDIGHFTAANGDSVAFIKEHHARITNLHVKDMKRNGGPYTPFGQGDAPIKEVLQLLSREKWEIPANLEYEYGDPDGTMAALEKCFKYCKDALA